MYIIRGSGGGFVPCSVIAHEPPESETCEHEPPTASPATTTLHNVISNNNVDERDEKKKISFFDYIIYLPYNNNNNNIFQCGWIKSIGAVIHKFFWCSYRRGSSKFPKPNQYKKKGGNFITGDWRQPKWQSHTFIFLFPYSFVLSVVLVLLLHNNL